MSQPAESVYVRQIAVGPMKNFVYLLGARDAAEVAVVDPAWDLPAIAAAAALDGKVIASAILTHGHHDHINAVPALLGSHDVPVYAHEREVDRSPELRALDENLRRTRGGDRVKVGPLELTLVHTPGHTPGSQCVLMGGALVSGDTLFVNACGRCDLSGGDPAQMFRSLHELLGALPGETTLYPGHDYGDVPVSSLARERTLNPYFRAATLEEFIAYRMRPR